MESVPTPFFPNFSSLLYFPLALEVSLPWTASLVNLYHPLPPPPYFRSFLPRSLNPSHRPPPYAQFPQFSQFPDLFPRDKQVSRKGDKPRSFRSHLLIFPSLFPPTSKFLERESMRLRWISQSPPRPHPLPEPPRPLLCKTLKDLDPV